MHYQRSRPSRYLNIPSMSMLILALSSWSACLPASSLAPLQVIPVSANSPNTTTNAAPSDSSSVTSSTLSSFPATTQLISSTNPSSVALSTSFSTSTTINSSTPLSTSTISLFSAQPAFSEVPFATPLPSSFSVSVPSDVTSISIPSIFLTPTTTVTPTITITPTVTITDTPTETEIPTATFLSTSTMNSVTTILTTIRPISASTINAPPPSSSPFVSPPSSTPDLHPSESTLLSTHNTWRSQFSAPPLTYNSTLASSSLSWSQTCAFRHSGGPYGENLAEGYGTLSNSVNAWGNEYKQYVWPSAPNPEGTGFSEATGHFTQVVWKGTTSVGCGWTQCSQTEASGLGGLYLVCRYWPEGNVVGVDWAENVGKKVI